MSLLITNDKISSIGAILNDVSLPIAQRFRALFTLKSIGGDKSIDEITKTLLNDDSILLKHECAYCLGQMQDSYANGVLSEVLSNVNEHAMVRHEAGEALGAIGNENSIPILTKFLSDTRPEVSETCKIAIQRIDWLRNNSKVVKDTTDSIGFTSIDPAPPLITKESVSNLKSVLINPAADLFERYRAMFALRNINTDESALALSEGLECPDSALFRHEIAYVLGQMQNPVTVEALSKSLSNHLENEMVRHECAEALGSIASDEANDVLKQYADDIQRVVRESVEVALDISDYATGDQFQYADLLHKV